MFESLLTATLFVSAAVGQCSTCNVGGGSAFMGGAPIGGGMVSGSMYDGGGYFDNSMGGGDPLYGYDDQEPWKHGYWQRMPSYGGYVMFRPYNYKHVLSQTQTAGGWGLAPTMAYSQQWWHRYHHQSRMQQRTTDASPKRQDPYLASGNRGSYEAISPPPRFNQVYGNSSGGVDPVTYQQQQSRLELMRQQVEQKELQIQSLRNAIQQQSYNVPQRR